MTDNLIDGASLRDRAVVNGAASVSALRAFVPSAFLLGVLLGACQPVEQANGNPIVEDTYSALPMVTDPATGCQYLGYTGHGLTPRLDRDGKPICGGAK